jgi:hypothetical protein
VEGYGDRRRVHSVLLPFMVAICPKEDHWVVKIYDGTKATPENHEAATTLHSEPSGGDGEGLGV